MELVQYNAPVIECDNFAIVEEQEWFLVFVAVLLALGATVVLGAAVWCLVQGKGSFTGAVKWDSGLSVNIECK
jgi:hypothetical protein